MSDQCEEQEMEAEALLAIFDDCAEIISSTQPFEWAVTLYPEQHGEGINHVGIKVIAKIPLDYPESLPTIDIEILKGLSDDHKQELAAMAAEEAQANLGLPSIFAVCERLREWLAENNQKGMDDVSMYAQMMRKQKEAAKQEVSCEWVVVVFVCCGYASWYIWTGVNFSFHKSMFLFPKVLLARGNLARTRSHGMSVPSCSRRQGGWKVATVLWDNIWSHIFIHFPSIMLDWIVIVRAQD
jgi:hypothetical protein